MAAKKHQTLMNDCLKMKNVNTAETRTRMPKRRIVLWLEANKLPTTTSMYQSAPNHFTGARRRYSIPAG